MPRPRLASHLQGLGTTIFAEMSALALRTGSVNLGQGFPDTDGPPELLTAAIEAIRAGNNQYPPGPGVPALRQAVSAHQQRFDGLTYDPDTEVLITTGATEAIASAILALCEPGDEVVAFEPFYDSYAATIAMAHAVRKPVTMRAPHFRFDTERLAAAITDRTRVLLFNSPHNPTGTVANDTELAAIAELCVRHDLIAVCDEVYEHLIFDGVRHRSLASMPGMRERSIVIGSAGKTFNCTGWKIGWTCASPELTAAVRTTKQFLTYVSGGPFQHAVATALTLPDSYYDLLAANLQARRDQLCAGLSEVGLTVHVPQATYFCTVDIGSLGFTDGAEFCWALPETAGVVAIPVSIFYDDPDAGKRLVRFAFCKKPDVIDEALTRLHRIRRSA